MMQSVRSIIHAITTRNYDRTCSLFSTVLANNDQYAVTNCASKDDHYFLTYRMFGLQ